MSLILDTSLSLSLSHSLIVDSGGVSSPGRDGRSRSPTYTTLGPPLDGRMRSHTTASGHVTNGSVTNSLITSLGVQLRNKDGKQRSSQAPVRRSRNMDKNRKYIVKCLTRV